MNILFATSELAPYAKTGGLGDVLAALPAVLQHQGYRVSIVIPLYRALKERLQTLKKSDLKLSIPIDGTTWRCNVWVGVTSRRVTVFALQRDELFDRSSLYGTEEGDYFDNFLRFAFFSRAVAELALHIEPKVDIIHANDWHAGLTSAYVRSLGFPFRTIFTIHNLAYQGTFPHHQFSRTGLPSHYFSPNGLEFYNSVNFLKAGIVYSDHTTTVSPGYAKEIQTELHGCGLNQVLSTYGDRLTGILNGIDTHVWNPASDPNLAANYDLHDLQGKEACKRELLELFRFKDTSTDLKDKPLFGIIARLVDQKGIPLLLRVFPEWIKRNIRLIILGRGQPEYHRNLVQWSKDYPEHIKVHIGYNEELAHKIEAGCDFFLMPSEFEPCGLNQLYSLRYGTIPIVHHTGGLGDSVTHWDGTHGNGFHFYQYTADSFLRVIDDAVHIYYQNKSAFNTLRHNAMTQDVSWHRSVQTYEKLYHQLMLSPTNGN